MLKEGRNGLPRIIYVLYIEQQPFADCLNAMRMLAEKAPRDATHVTVCGPFTEELPRDQIEDINRRIRGQSIIVNGVNTFWSAHQNTVYLEVEGDFLYKVGRRTDFPDYIPHITIYNNDKRKWACKVLCALKEFPFSFRVTVGSLRPIITGIDPANGHGNGHGNGNGKKNGNGNGSPRSSSGGAGNGYKRVITDFPPQLMKKITRHEFTPEEIRNFDSATRLARMRKIVQYLSTRI